MFLSCIDVVSARVDDMAKRWRGVGSKVGWAVSSKEAARETPMKSGSGLAFLRFQAFRAGAGALARPCATLPTIHKPQTSNPHAPRQTA